MTYRVFTARPSGPRFSERLEWKTELEVAPRSAREFVQRVRAYPRYRYEFTVPAYDAATRAALSGLRDYAGQWLLPIWPHMASGAALPRVLGTDGRMLCAMPGGELVESVGTPVAGALDTLPAAVARIVDSVRVAHTAYTTETLAEARVAFQLVNFREAVAPWSDATVAGHPVFDFFIEGTDAREEEVSRDAEFVDFDLLWLEDVRHLAIRHTMTIALIGTAEVVRFRQFLWAIAGRWAQFWMQCPGDTEPRLYRLAADAVETEYTLNSARAPDYALTKLTVYRLQVPLAV